MLMEEKWDGGVNVSVGGRLDSPGVMRNVLQPLEEKIHEYESLMQQAYEQRAYIDEEIRLRQERRYVAEREFAAAQAKHDEYQCKLQAVSRALHGNNSARSHLLPDVHESAYMYHDANHNVQSQHQPKVPAQRSSKGPLQPSHSITNHQLFYILVLHGIGSLVISGGINFGLAYPMYTTQDTVKNPIRLFQLPNTLSGDAAVTIIIQCIITWFVEKALVALDLSKGGVQPIGFISKPRNFIIRWLLLLPSLNHYSMIEQEFEGKPKPHDTKKGILGQLISILQNALRGFCVAVIGFLLLWPVSVGILTQFGERRGGDYYFSDRWVPQIFKGLLGGVLGLLTSPVTATIWLIRAGWDGR